MDIDETVQPRAEEELNTVPTPPIPSARTNSLAMAAFPWFNGSILTAGPTDGRSRGGSTFNCEPLIRGSASIQLIFNIVLSPSARRI